jgi:hypothetical protein
MNVICGFLEDVDLSQQTFDVVCIFGVLEHLHDINETLGIITRVLKSGGRLCIEVPDTKKPEAQVSEFFSFEHMSHFTLETLMIFLKGYGYSNCLIDDQVTDARLRIIAQKTSVSSSFLKERIDPKDRVKLIDTRNKLILKVNSYKETKKEIEKDIRERLTSKIIQWKKQRKRIAIYGAGIHTRYLLNLFELSENVTAIIDTDPQKKGNKFLRWMISDESLLEEGVIDVVIISSKRFEDEIYQQIAKYTINPGIEIHCCYSQQS